MKKFKKNLPMIIFITLILLSPLSFAVPWFTLALDQTEGIRGIPNKIQGLYIFTDSEPDCNCELLGVVKIAMSLDPQYKTLRKRFIDKSRKQYPKANALKLLFDNQGSDECEILLCPLK